MTQNDIIESFVMGKTGDLNKSEDILVIGEHFYAVIDGVTSKFPIKYEGKSTGRYCAELIAEAISHLDKDIDAQDALEEINEAVKKSYGNTEITLESKMQACIIIYSKARREVWSYGDCQLMINGELFDHTKRIDTLFVELRSFVVSAYLEKAGNESDLYENDVGREAILPFLKKQSLFANKDGYFGYPVIDGTGINKKLIKAYKVSEGDRVVLASDGYPRLFSTLKESEKYLDYALKVDPLAIKENMQTKMKSKENLSFDDRAYLSFIV